MLFFLIFLYCYLSVLILISIGYIINIKFLKITEVNNFVESSLVGIVFISFISLFLNFFSNLNQYLNSLCFLFLIYFLKLINFKQLKKVLNTSLIISFFAYITFILDHSNRPDAGLYHLPYISILNEHKIIFGSANLHYRFGHISILQYFSAIFNNFIFKDNGVLIPLAILYGSFVSFFLFNSFNKNNSKHVKFLSFLFLFYILTAMNRYSGFGNDAPAHMFYFLIIFYFVSEKQKLEKTTFFNKILYFSLFLFLIKQFFAMIVLLPIVLLIYYYKKINFLNAKFIFCSFFLSIWLLKNIIISSCIIYPLNITCFDKLPWSTKNAQKIAIESEAWSKDWPNRTDKNDDYQNYISDNRWIKVWFKNHFKVFKKKLLPLVVILGIMSFIFLLKGRDKKNKFEKKNILIPMFLSLFFSIIWFFNFPLYRFGESFLVSFISLAFIYLFYFNLNKKNDLSDKTVLSFIIILFFIIFAKNIIRINNNFEVKYIDYPWPKKNSYSELNDKNKNIPVIEDSNIIYYISYPYSLCMYSKSPCTHVQNLNIKKKKFFIFYDMFYRLQGSD